MEDDSKNRTREVAETILDKVAAVIAAVKDATRANQVVCALHSLAVRLFPLDSHALSGQSPTSIASVWFPRKKT